MKLTIVKWGHSAAIRLPATLLAQLDVKVDDSFDGKVSRDTLTLRVAKDTRTIELTVVTNQDGTLSLRIKDLALGETGAHIGSDRLQANPNHAEFYQATIDAIMEYKKGGATVVFNGTVY